MNQLLFLLVSFGLASSQLPQRRQCDPERRRDTPTPCSNYENIVYLDRNQKNLVESQKLLQRRLDDAQSELRSRLDYTKTSLSALENVVRYLVSRLSSLERIKTQKEREFKDIKTQLWRQRCDVDSLRSKVGELVRHSQIVGGNFSQIEEKLDTTERQLTEKKARLDDLEEETEAAFNDTQTLLGLLKNELSHFNVTARELEVKVEARLDATETQLQEKMEKIQKSNKGLTVKLTEQRAEVGQFKLESNRKFRHVEKQLKAQNTSLDKQRTDIGSLKSHTAGVKKKIKSVEGKLAERNQVSVDVRRIKAEVFAKVAFSASLNENFGALTGPRKISTKLIFDKVFTNIGNAYNCFTGGHLGTHRTRSW
ncbi:uncharacterized protein V6R79_018322 [Siganus canaliculatus]